MSVLSHIFRKKQFAEKITSFTRKLTFAFFVDKAFPPGKSNLPHKLKTFSQNLKESGILFSNTSARTNIHFYLVPAVIYLSVQPVSIL